MVAQTSPTWHAAEEDILRMSCAPGVVLAPCAFMRGGHSHTSSGFPAHVYRHDSSKNYDIGNLFLSVADGSRVVGSSSNTQYCGLLL